MEARAFYYFRGRYTLRQNSKIVERGSLSQGNQNSLRKTGFVFGTEQDVCTMIRAFFSPTCARRFGRQAQISRITRNPYLWNVIPDKQKSRDEIRMRFVPGPVEINVE